MSTHTYNCVVCGKQTSCNHDEHALGAGTGSCYEEGPTIEFCSGTCFVWLEQSMAKRRIICESEFPHLLTDLK